MRTKVRKWFWVWEFKKEEKWLNDMAAQGKALVQASLGSYEFEDCRPGAYIIRLQMLEHAPGMEEGQAYIHFVEETGAEHVGSVQRWAYFRRKAEQGSFELMGDNATRIKHLRNIMWTVIPLALLNLFNAFNSIRVSIERPMPVMMVVGAACAAVTLLLAYALYRLNAEKRRLEKESQLFE